MPLSPKDIRAFRSAIYTHHRKHGRSHLPWRQTRDPYRILVSEVMLQQTQVESVIPKYRKFLRRFPTARSLARAPLREVLRAWQGLGYNRRALSLHRAAKAIVADHRGRVPEDMETLLTLPGVGPYTAGAVQAFAWNRAHPVIETNIRRIYLHHFFKKRKGVHDRKLFPLIETTLDRRNPARWYAALMDYGVHLARTEGNANRRSAHYAVRPPYKGSNREVRGKVLRLLAEDPRTPRQLLKELKGVKEKPLLVVLKQLTKEGFLEQRGTRYRPKDL